MKYIIELYEEMNIPVPVFEQYLDINTNHNTVVSKIRSILGLTLEKQSQFKNSNMALNYYLEAFNQLGILVFQTGKVDKSEMKGLSIYESQFPIIVLNRKDEYNARIFTLFHEIVHLLTRTAGICDTIDLSRHSAFEVEIICNSVAAEALVPAELLIQQKSYESIIQYGCDDTYIQKLSRTFSVSREVIIGRLLTLKVIDLPFYRTKLSQYSDEYAQFESKKKTGGFLPPSTDVCSQVGKLYARTVMSAYSQELISPKATSQLLSGLRMQHFDKVERWCFS